MNLRPTNTIRGFVQHIDAERLFVFSLIAVPLGFVLALLAALNGWYLAAAASVTFMGVLVVTTHMHRTLRLEARIREGRDTMWEVMVNDATVGRISDAEHAACVLSAHRDPRLFVAQAMNLCAALLRAVASVAVQVPVVLIWLVIWTAISSPADLSLAAAQLANAPVQQVQAGVNSLLYALLTISTVVTAAHAVLWGRDFGIVDRLAEAVDRSLRLHCNCAAHGRPMLFRNTVNGRVYRDEWKGNK